jgi:hypothetical protein
VCDDDDSHGPKCPHIIGINDETRGSFGETFPDLKFVSFDVRKAAFRPNRPISNLDREDFFTQRKRLFLLLGRERDRV